MVVTAIVLSVAVAKGLREEVDEMKPYRTSCVHVALASLVCVAALITTMPAGAADLRVEIDGRVVPMRSMSRPYLHSGVWMLPARPILDAARISYEWDFRRQVLDVWTIFDRLTLSAGSYSLLHAGGSREVLSRPMVVRNGEPFVPIDFLETCLRKQAYYDRRANVLSFGRRFDDRRWDGDRWSDQWRDRWNENRGNPWERQRRQVPLTIEAPRETYMRSVRISGRWGGSSVRIRIYRSDGKAAINRTISVRNDKWYADLTLSRDVYRIVVEGLDRGSVRETRETRLRVR